MCGEQWLMACCSLVRRIIASTTVANEELGTTDFLDKSGGVRACVRA
jgi:hypothetical protein